MVHAYVFYSLYVVNGEKLMSINSTKSVLQTINIQGGVYMMGNTLPIWALILIKFPFAFFSQLFFIQPLVRGIFKLIVRPNKKVM